MDETPLALRDLLTLHKLTAADLAARLGRPPRDVQRWAARHTEMSGADIDAVSVTLELDMLTTRRIVAWTATAKAPTPDGNTP